jgi:prepilin-type N-terminal cleavage/methylation domain-containing protein
VNIVHILKSGFTLAEVLLTLLIVGVISSMVIPGIIADTQQAEYKAKWKKAYSSINQAYNQIIMDNGGTFVSAATSHSGFRNLFMNKMNYIATCNDTSCAASSLRKFNGAPDGYAFNKNNLVLNDGTIMTDFRLDSANCTHSGYVYNTGGECGWMLVDINGKKSPNQWGKDIYGIFVLKNQILPWGANPAGTATSVCAQSTCSTSGSGYGCGAKYLYN